MNLLPSTLLYIWTSISIHTNRYFPLIVHFLFSGLIYLLFLRAHSRNNSIALACLFSLAVPLSVLISVLILLGGGLIRLIRLSKSALSCLFKIPRRFKQVDLLSQLKMNFCLFREKRSIRRFKEV